MKEKSDRLWISSLPAKMRRSTMKQEDVSVRGTSEASLVVGTSSPHPVDGGGAGPPRLDFLSAEFNTVDELDDNVGNFRTFQSLDGVVTADMRYHEERKRMKPSATAIDEKQAEEAEAKNSGSMVPDAEDAAPLTVISKGRTLIVDTDPERVADYGRRLNEQGLTCTLCVRGGAEELARIDSLNLMHVDSVSVSGGFGGFKATVFTGDGQTDQTGRFAGSFDLVLDLQSVPSYTGKQLPIGYYAPGEDSASLEKALGELIEMKGRFNKPQFTVFQESNCLHGRSPSRECPKCLQICPFEAIKSAQQGIVIDPYICQGCGGCALVCSVDAIRMQQPPQEEILASLRNFILDSLVQGDLSPVLTLYDKEIGNEVPSGMADTPERGCIFYGVEEIGRIGLEILLAALAYGGGSVLLVCDHSRPAAIREELQRQVQLARTIVQGLHMPADCIRFFVRQEGAIDPQARRHPESGPAVEPIKPLGSPAAFSPEHDKQTLTRLAAQHLAEAAGLRQHIIPLPEGAPFGSVAIDATACTFCMACAGACPSDALTAGGDLPRLSLVESLCHQCGLCVAACPEHAIRLLPRLLCSKEAADSQTVLREAKPFNCVECGKPFASLAMINRVQEKLTGHWMYSSDRQVRRLRMCRTCRTRDALMARDFQS